MPLWLFTVGKVLLPRPNDDPSEPYRPTVKLFIPYRAMVQTKQKFIVQFYILSVMSRFGC